MRLQCKKPLTIRNRILGGPVPWICLPMVAEDRASLLRQAQELVAYRPDALEWRVDKLKSGLRYRRRTGTPWAH